MNVAHFAAAPAPCAAGRAPEPERKAHLSSPGCQHRRAPLVLPEPSWRAGSARSTEPRRHAAAHKPKVCSSQRGALFLHLFTLCLWVANISSLLYLLWCSVISDLWCYPGTVLGCCEPHPHKAPINKRVSWLLHKSMAPHSLPCLGPPCSLKHSKTETRPISNPMGYPSAQGKEQSHVPHFKLKARND